MRQKDEEVMMSLSEASQKNTTTKKSSTNIKLGRIKQRCKL